VYAHGNEVLAAARTSWDKPRLALQGAARVLANSRFTALAAERAGAHPDRIVVVSPGCDTDLFRPLPAEPELRQRLLGERAGDRILLTVGGLVARKGHDTVIRALPAVLRSCPDVTYLIAASDGRNYEALDGLARATGVRDRVVFALHVSDADLPQVYALADLFVMPSRAHLDNCDVEGFGMVFLEANACGKAVVAGRSGGIPDAVLDGVTGLLVDPLSPDAVAAELVTLLTNHGLRAKLGEQGRLRVVNGFTWAHVGRKVHEIMEGL
jgi:phosphatidylinositol alpha-1,6-mannosyltransferase